MQASLKPESSKNSSKIIKVVIIIEKIKVVILILGVVAVAILKTVGYILWELPCLGA